MIGGGIVGLCSAYYLAKAGHEVAVIERRGNVAEEASFGQPAIISPASILSQAMPAMPKSMLASFFKKESGVIFKPQMDRSLWRWLRLWLDEATPDRYQVNADRLHRLALYSQQLMRDIEEVYQPEFEQVEGALHLLRTEAELAQADTMRERLAATGINVKILDPDAVRALEPGLSPKTQLAGALYAADDLSGNCALFAKQLKQIVQSLGVQFHFNSHVDALEPGSREIGIRIGAETFHVDAVVVAGGSLSGALLSPLGIDLPLHAMKGYTATATIKDYDSAPQGSIVDPTAQVAISRMGNRIRISGVVEPGIRDNEINAKAVRTLIHVASEWFPLATNYNAATFWAGMRPMLPEGIPVIGPTRVPNLYINTGHGAAAWSLAAGSGRLLADLISQQAPEIDLTGLTPERYG